jgi:hypothetical protein
MNLTLPAGGTSPASSSYMEGLRIASGKNWRSDGRSAQLLWVDWSGALDIWQLTKMNRMSSSRPEAFSLASFKRRARLFQCLLLPYGAVPVVPAAFMEVVTQHALAKQKKDDCQDDYKQELSNSERGWLSSGRGRRIHFTCPP